MQDRIDTERLILEFDTNEELANAANITLYTASRVLSAWQRTDERKSVLANAPNGQLGIEGESKRGGSCHFFGKFAPYLLSRGFWPERLLRPRLSGILGNSKR